MEHKKPLFIGKKITKTGIGIDILWFLVILAGFLFYTSLIPMPPNDFWWHLKIGESIFSTHSIPTTNIYAWTLPPDQPFYYAAWLGELLLYGFYRLGGLELDIFMRTLMLGISFMLLGYEAHRRSGSWRIAALVIAIGGLLSSNNLPLRTQIWAWLPFIITYLVLQRYSEGKLRWFWLFLCPGCMVFWVNVHGSFILGLVLPFIFFSGQIISKLIKQNATLTWKKIGWIGAIGVLNGLAAFINPRGTGIIQYAVNLLSNQPIQQIIEEWQAPTPHGIANISFYISILLLLVIIAYSTYKLHPGELLLIGGFLWLAWNGQRSVIWYGFIILPIIAQLIGSLPIKLPTFTPQKNWLNLAIAILLFVPVVLVQPWFVEKIPLPDTYWQQVLRNSQAGPLLSVNTPVEATEYLKKHPGGRLYNEMGYGSYLIWADSEQGVFIDPRIELFPYNLWMDYIHINNGTNYEEILSKYGVDRILLDKNIQPDLAGALSTDSFWKLEYDDQNSQIWNRKSIP
jgi:hypothetical protein